MSTVLQPPIPLSALLPEIILLAGGCLVLLCGQVSPERARRYTARLALASIVLAIVAVVTRAWWPGELLPAGNGLLYGPLALFARNSALVLGFVIALVAWLQPKPGESGEFWTMVLFSLAGVLLVGAANDLLMLWVALELVSIPTYILVALSRHDARAQEAATKYFYLGAMSAALSAYGFALLYGVSGTTTLVSTGRVGAEALPSVLEGVQAALAAPGTLAYGVAVVGLVLAVGGLLFKIAAVPLHFYIADVYQGAASPVAGLLGFVPKFAGFLAITKILQITGHWNVTSPPMFWLLWLVSAVSMTVGNALALMQTNVKRLLAYSGIAHSGYMLVGLLIGPAAGEGLLGDGTAAVMYYIVIYGLANLGAFAVLGLLRSQGRPAETLRDLAGLLRRHPGLALLLAFAMFTLMGLPPTAGFWGKFSLFGSALAGVAGGQAAEPYHTWLVVLVVVALLNSALAAAYYLRVIAAVLLYENDQPAEAVPEETPHVGAALCGFLLLVFTFCPGWLLEPGRRAAANLLHPGWGLVGVEQVAPERQPTALTDENLVARASRPPASRKDTP